MNLPTATNVAACWFVDVFFWYAGGSVVLLWIVFHSTRLDYRLILAGAVLPGIENLSGRDWFFHTLAAPVVVLAVVMVATRSNRLVRRRLICLPIGMFFALVLDGVWTTSSLFWWPLLSTGFPSTASLMTSRPLIVNLALEVAGLAALVWAYKRFGLDDPARRKRLLTTGTLDPSLALGPEAGM